MSSEEIKNIGITFFKSQDKIKGQPASELCTSDYKAHIAGNPPLDYEGHKQFGIMFYTGFPDLAHNIKDVITDGNKVVVRFTLTGTHTSNFMGIPPTNKSINVSAIAILDVVDGKVKEVNGEFNQMSLMQQLGLVPEQVNS